MPILKLRMGIFLLHFLVLCIRVFMPYLPFPNCKSICIHILFIKSGARNLFSISSRDFIV